MAEEPKTEKKRKEKYDKIIQPRERKFVQNLLRYGNYAQAYLMAGYTCSRKNAYKSANRLLRYPRVWKYYEDQLAKRDHLALIDSAKLVELLTQIAYFDVTDVASWKKSKVVTKEDEDGRPYVSGIEIDVTNSKNIDGRLIEEIIMSPKEGFKIKTVSKMQAVNLLAKMKGLLIERVEHTGDLTINIKVE